MPRYFFHRTDGVFDPDTEGTDLAGLGAARVEAVRFAADSVRDKPEQVWEGATFRVEVSDEAGNLLCTVIVLGVDAPAARERSGAVPLSPLASGATT